MEAGLAQFRRARAEDVPVIAALLADDPLGAAREDPTHPEAYLAAFRTIDADPRNLLAVAEIGGAVCGCLQLTFIPGLSNRGAEFALVQAVRIDSSQRGRGLGAAFMTWAIHQARERGCAFIELLTHETRIDAQRFYERLGFVASHRGMRRGL